MSRFPGWLPWAMYGPLALLGGWLSWWRRGTLLAPPGLRFSESALLAHATGVLLALLVTWVTVLATRWLVAKTRWARALHFNLRGALLGTPAPQLLGLALSSAIAEELFFRAALLPWLGLFASALIFGLLHVAPGELSVGWMLWASVMGVVFGLLYLASGSLLAPILAHAAINYENMQYLCHHDPTLADTARASTHGARPR